MGKKVLVVEDDATLRKVYALKLDMEGYDVVTANDGQEALELVKQLSPDLIILDMMMPRLDGMGFLREYAGTDNRAKVLIASNKSFKADIDEAKRLGASGYLVKSQITPADLVARVQEHLAA